jgi:hypothetical protein
VGAATYQERLRALRSALDGWGYEGLISEGFPIWSPSAGRQLLRADLVAFTHHEQRDISTSAVVAQVIDATADLTARWLPAAAALGAPAMLAAFPDRLALWSTAIDVSAASEIASVPVTAPATIVSRTANLSPEAISHAKSQGFYPALFPLGLDVLNSSRRQARTYLTREVEHALKRVAGLHQASRDDLAAKLVIGALAILMIRDKASTAALADISHGAMIDVSQQRYPGYFDWLNALDSDELQLFSAIVDNLGSNINFASLEPAMVSDVYEQALVTEFARREQGTYYTPPQLARQMLAAIPFETIEPDRRAVLDPACGSGTMLLAAASRLTSVQPEPISPSIWHRYLVGHLRGYDSDPLATEITRLCLLMTAMPIGNSWQVETIDSLDARIPLNARPTVIVSNPPWKFRRQGVQPAERANLFLSWMLSNLDDRGYLACVVPLSWINKNNSRKMRSALLDQADLLEVWRLPSKMFRSTGSAIAPAVIVAQKHPINGYRPHISIIKTVRDGSASDFLSTGRANEAYLVEPKAEGDRIVFGPLSRELAKLDDFVSLEDVANVYTGWTHKSGRPYRSETEATHHELGSLRDLRPFGHPDHASLRPVRYPEDYHHVRATDERVRAAKVVVTSKHFSTTNPWRLNVAYDPVGIVVREMFISIIPRADWGPWSDLSGWDRQCIVMAALGSGLASCWIDEKEPTRNISIRYIKSFVLPSERAALRRLASIGNRMVDVVASGEQAVIEDCGRQLEATVNDVYKLTGAAKALISRRLEGAPAPEGAMRYRPVSNDPYPVAIETTKERDATQYADDAHSGVSIPSFGHVLDVNEQGLRVWVSGITQEAGTWILPPPQLPGFLCRPGADFTVVDEENDLYTARYGFHLYEWLSVDALTPLHQDGG